MLVNVGQAVFLVTKLADSLDVLCRRMLRYHLLRCQPWGHLYDVPISGPPVLEPVLAEPVRALVCFVAGGVSPAWLAHLELLQLPCFLPVR